MNEELEVKTPLEEQLEESDLDGEDEDLFEDEDESEDEACDDEED